MEWAYNIFVFTLRYLYCIHPRDAKTMRTYMIDRHNEVQEIAAAIFCTHKNFLCAQITHGKMKEAEKKCKMHYASVAHLLSVALKLYIKKSIGLYVTD